MGAEYIEHQDEHGKTKAISMNIEAVEKLNAAAGAALRNCSKDSTFPGKS